VIASLFGLDANEWQAIFAGVAALGALAAALVAWRALKYFKSQTEEMKASNAATREQMEMQERRWEDEQRRERRHEHAAIRPVLEISLGDGRMHPAHESGVGLTFDCRRGAARHLTASVSLIDRDVAGECVPDHWAEINGLGALQFVVRISAAAVGDRGTLSLTYVDQLGAPATYTYPLRVTDADHLALARDDARATALSDDL
jgi:hypothetical protein